MSSNRNKKSTDSVFDKKMLSPTYSLPEVLSPNAREKIMLSRLGPGTYNCSSSTLAGPAFRFGHGLRFNYDDPLAKYMKLSRRESFPLYNLPSLDLDSFKPSSKLSRIKKEAINLTNKLITVRETKKKLQIDRKEKIIKFLHEKNEKFEIRRKVKDFKFLAFKMVDILMILGFTCQINSKIDRVKFYRKKIAMFVRTFGYTCLAIGKFHLSLRRFRVFKAYRAINKAVARIRVWIAKKKVGYCQKIILKIESYLKKPLLQVSLFKFLTKITSLQRYWRKSLEFKKTTQEAKFQIFRHLESSALSHIKNKKKYKIPKHIIQKELKQFTKTKLKNYLTAIKKYKEKCLGIQRSHSKVALKVITDYGIKASIIPSITYSRAPKVSYVIKKKKYLEMINTLMHRRSLWEQ